MKYLRTLTTTMAAVAIACGLGGMPTASPALASAPLYLASKNAEGVYELYRVELGNPNKGTKVGEFPSGKWNNIAITPDGTTLHAIRTDENNQVVEFDLLDLPPITPTQICATISGGFSGRIAQLAYRSDGTLYGTSTGTDKLYTFDLDTCSSTEVGTVEDGASMVDVVGGDITFDQSGTLFLININSATLYEVDPANGDATPIGPLSGPAPASKNTGLTATLGDDLVMSNKDDNLYSVNKTTAATLSLGKIDIDGMDLNIRAGDLASLAAYDGIDDGCKAGEGGIDDGANIDSLWVNSNGTSIFIYMTLCGELKNGTKYRVHLDLMAPFATDPDLRESEVCALTSEDTMVHAIHRNGNSKDTGPGIIMSDGNMLWYEVSYDELGLYPGDQVLVSADTQARGIVDRAPDTNDSDGCSKPTGSGEVLTLETAIGRNDDPYHGGGKNPNSGRGNGSEGDPDQDPGNSGKNQGGD